LDLIGQQKINNKIHRFYLCVKNKFMKVKAKSFFEDVFDPFCKLFFPIIPKWLTPNMLSTTRLIGVPFLVYVLWDEQYVLGLILFIILALTDMFDGALARGRNQITELGKVLDPVADKLLIGSAILIILLKINLPLAVLVVGLDAIIILLGLIMKASGSKLDIKANVWGKIKLNLQVGGIALVFLGLLLSLPILIVVAQWVLWLAVVFAILSIISGGL